MDCYLYTRFYCMLSENEWFKNSIKEIYCINLQLNPKRKGRYMLSYTFPGIKHEIGKGVTYVPNRAID